MPSPQKTVLITGGSRGLGFAAARRLAQQGLRVILTARKAGDAEAAAARIRAEIAGAAVRALPLDLTDFTGVRAFTERLLSDETALHIVIASAGVLSPPKQPTYSRGGHEIAFATNHLGHFLLVTRLLPLLERAAAETGEARVVVVSSRLHQPGSRGAEVRFDFDDVDLRRDYDPEVAYKNSKLANLWFTYALDRRARDKGITANAFCPGFIPVTAAEGAQGFSRFMLKYVLPRLPFANSVDEAAEMYLFVATDPALKGVGGNYYIDKQAVSSSPASYDPEKAERLWRLSEQLTAGE